MNADPIDPDIDRRLAALEEASDRRRAELSAVLHDLPAAVSRREVLASVFRDVRDGPGRGSVVRGVLHSMASIPRKVIARFRHRPSA